MSYFTPEISAEEALLRAIFSVPDSDGLVYVPEAEAKNRIPKHAPKQPQYILKHRSKIILIDTYEACYARLCEEAFKNDGMTITRKENKRA